MGQNSVKPNLIFWLQSNLSSMWEWCAAAWSSFQEELSSSCSIRQSESGGSSDSNRSSVSCGLDLGHGLGGGAKSASSGRLPLSPNLPRGDSAKNVTFNYNSGNASNVLKRLQNEHVELTTICSPVQGSMDRRISQTLSKFCWSWSGLRFENFSRAWSELVRDF